MTTGQEAELELESKDRVACTDCKTPNLIEVGRPSDDSRIIRFVGVTDAPSNKHRFPHEVMEQMVNDAKDRYVLPFMPSSVKDIDKKTLDVFLETKEFGLEKDPIAMRDMHLTDAQRTKVGRVLNVAVKSKPDTKNGGIGRKWMEVVAEVFDPHTIRLIDRGMAKKFSIGFKHKYDVVDGIKVSNYGVIDHFGFVDIPADPEAVLLEKKEENNMPGATQDCIQAKVAEGMSQEEAAKACGESAGKASALTPGGEPSPDKDRAFTDCVQGLVASGLDQDEAERACHDKAGNPQDSHRTDATQGDSPSGEPQMKQEQKDLAARLQRLENESKQYSSEVKSLKEENKRLAEENKQRAVAAEIKVLMDQGRVTPATKEKTFGFATALPDEKAREAYYDTLSVAVDFDEKSRSHQEESYTDGKLDEAAKEMWGSSVEDLVTELKGRRS